MINELDERRSAFILYRTSLAKLAILINSSSVYAEADPRGEEGLHCHAPNHGLGVTRHSGLACMCPSEPHGLLVNMGIKQYIYVMQFK